MTPDAAPRPLRRPPRLPSWAGRNFQLLTAASVITSLGNSGALIAAAFAVIESGGSATDVGLVAAARTLPLVVFLLIGGALADRLPRNQVMVAANVLNSASQAVFATLIISGHAQLWQMAALTAVGGTAHAFFSPASEGMLLATVDPAHANKAFSVFRVGMNGANIGGAALGGALVAAIGPGWVLAVDAAAFAVAASLRSFLTSTGNVRSEPGGGMLRDLGDGWREFASRRWLWGIVVQFSVVNAVFTASEAVYGPLVSDERLGGAGPWGLALAAFGAGTVGGGVLMMRWKPRRLLLAGTLSIFALALPPAALALVLPAAGLAALMFVTGVGVEVFAVGWMLALHQEIPGDKLSRVSSYDWFGSVAMVPVATALAGPAMNTLGRPAALWGCSGLVVLLTGAVLLLPEVRQLTRRETSPVAQAAPTPVPVAVTALGAAQPTAKAPSGGSGDGTAVAS
ncbi:MFS transporter [Streptomyces sp. H39-S7]|uniref:MFS transporter n=1 Tax=Streptomyces sp. H39-S7 TaxID=3004357 RepID=UPI0022AED6AA|nr:MFS transporter [Streptomyces sp. H39-S7]MCZ4124230.1 MFS transporter [Streptomyces sp. H39-S7]